VPRAPVSPIFVHLVSVLYGLHVRKEF